MIGIPPGVRAMADRGPDWSAWVAGLPALLADVVGRWRLRPDGPPLHGNCSLVVPVRTEDATPAVLKVSFPEPDSEHEHIVLRHWGGRGAVRLLRADPHRRALLLERLLPEDLGRVGDIEACRVVAGLYRQIHLPALPQLRTLSSLLAGWTAELAGLAGSAPIPRRLLEQAISLGADLASDRSVADRVLHTDLHYANVLAGGREPWLAIDPKPVNGDPHYEIAPMLWNRFDELAGDVRAGVRRRFWALVDAGQFSADRARAWVIVRMVHNARWALADGTAGEDWLTTCVAVAKAVGD